MRSIRVRGLAGTKASACAAALASAACLVATPAHAGNMDAFYLSGDAALQAGAITADARGGGAAWYNPAGLAQLRGLRIDVSVNGYSIRFGGNADFDSQDPNAQITRLSHLDLNVVPTALTMTYNYKDIGLAFGIFVPTQTVSSLRTQLEVPGGPLPINFALDTYQRYQEYHLGPSVGFRASSDVDLGASLLVNYRTSVQMADLFLSVGANEGGVGTMTHSLVDWIQVGAEFVLGAQWRFAKGWRLGAVARTPSLRLGQDLQTVDSSIIASGSGPPSAAVEFKEDFGISTTFLAPARFHVGLSHDIGDVRVAAEASMQMPLTNDGLQLKLRATPNARLGFRRRLSQTFAYGGGVFTDLSPFDRPREFGDSRINYYGLTGSVAFATPYGVITKNGVTYPETRTMLFETTVSLSYAAGFGSVMRANVAADQSAGISYTEVPADVLAHEISLHLGTTVME